MAKPPPPPPAVTLPDWFMPVVSLGCLILFVLHSSETVKLDSIGVLLVAGGAAVWILPQVSKIKLGDVELELKLDALIEAQAEPEGPAPPFNPKDWLFAVKGTMLVEDTTNGQADTGGGGQRPDVLTALHHPRYAFRTEAGLARDTGLAVDDLRKTLQTLERRGLVLALSGTDRRPLWTLTADGKAQL